MEKKVQKKAVANWLGSGSINIFGRPFAGKDTQGRYLAQLFDGALMGGGDILRASVVPERVKECLRRGELIPSEDYVNIVLPHLSRPEFKNRPLILSSVGRWHGEEPGIMQATAASGHPLKAVIYLSLSEDTVRQRWRSLEHRDDRGGRHDDNEETLEVRLREFKLKTLPVIDYYRELKLLIELDGSMSLDDVQQIIVKRLVEHSEQFSHASTSP